MKVKKMNGRCLCGECYSKNPNADFIYPVWKITFGAGIFKRTMFLCKHHIDKLQKKLKAELRNYKNGLREE